MNSLKLKLATLAVFMLLPLAVLAQVQLGIGVAELSINADSTAAVVTGTAFSIPTACNLVTWTTSFGTTPASVTIQLQLSVDNSVYVLADSSTNTAGESRTVVNGARFLRIVESARSGGTLVTVSVICKQSPVINPIAPVLFADGNGANPSISFLSNKFDGFYRRSTGVIGVTANGNPIVLFSGKLLFPAAAALCWAPTSDIEASQSSNTADAGLVRLAAGVMSFASCDVAGGYSARANFWNSSALSALSFTVNTIAPTGSTHSVGAGLIKTITVPAQCTPTCTIHLIPTAAFTYDNTGNISVASGTAVIGRTMDFTWDGTKWNPSY